jgi:hypothetical protein
MLLRKPVAIDRFFNMLSMFKDELTTGMPVLAGFQFDLENDASICESTLRNFHFF